jgi:plasmid replication initiation protein
MPQKKPLETRNFIVKSNALVEARYRLSLQESHVILWLLMQIRPDDEDFKIHQLNINDFAKMVGLKVKGQYGELEKITESLMRRILKLRHPETEDILQVAWLSSARYQKKKGNVLLRFDPGLQPYLLQLKSHFTKIDIVDTLKLKSVHAVRVFELLLQYSHIGKREISLQELRSYCGIGTDEYALYADLKRKVINRAKTEINAKTEYEVNYKEIKQSRKVTALEWTIQKKTHFEKIQSQKADIIQKELRSELVFIERMSEYGFSKQAAKKLLKCHGEEVLENALKAVDLQVQKSNVKNPKAMLLTAIQEKWKPDVYKKKKL